MVGLGMLLAIVGGQEILEGTMSFCAGTTCDDWGEAPGVLRILAGLLFWLSPLAVSAAFWRTGNADRWFLVGAAVAFSAWLPFGWGDNLRYAVLWIAGPCFALVVGWMIALAPASAVEITIRAFLLLLLASLLLLLVGVVEVLRELGPAAAKAAGIGVLWTFRNGPVGLRIVGSCLRRAVDGVKRGLADRLRR
jgi:hypothetical protein